MARLGLLLLMIATSSCYQIAMSLNTGFRQMREADYSRDWVRRPQFLPLYPGAGR